MFPTAGSGGAVAEVAADVTHHDPPLVLVEEAVDAHQLATVATEMRTEHDRATAVVNAWELGA